MDAVNRVPTVLFVLPVFHYFLAADSEEVGGNEASLHPYVMRYNSNYTIPLPGIYIPNIEE
jgi:hypothetical protein